MYGITYQNVHTKNRMTLCDEHVEHIGDAQVHDARRGLCEVCHPKVKLAGKKGVGSKEYAADAYCDLYHSGDLKLYPASPKKYFSCGGCGKFFHGYTVKQMQNKAWDKQAREDEARETAEALAKVRTYEITHPDY